MLPMSWPPTALASPTRARLGIVETGTGSFGHSVNVLFRADLSPYVHGKPFMLFWIVNGETQGTLGSASRDQTRWTYNFDAQPGVEYPESAARRRDQASRRRGGHRCGSAGCSALGLRTGGQREVARRTGAPRGRCGPSLPSTRCLRDEQRRAGRQQPCLEARPGRARFGGRGLAGHLRSGTETGSRSRTAWLALANTHALAATGGQGMSQRRTSSDRAARRGPRGTRAHRSGGLRAAFASAL